MDNLPHISYLSDRGAGSLIELISSLNNQSVLNLFPRGVQSTSGLTSTTTFPVNTSSTLLELPGEATRLKFIPALQHQNSGNSSSPSSMATGMSTEGHQVGLLYLADILPTVVRVPSAGGRRISLRANNGRVFHYDIPCLPRELPAGRGVSVIAADATEAGSMAPTLAAYEGWREAWCPLHLFQALNDVASKFPETAKRRINLATPR